MSSSQLDRNTSEPDAKTIAYFCRAYAMEKSLKLKGSATSGEINTFLMALMSQLESEKGVVPNTSMAEGKVRPIISPKMEF